MKKLVFLRHGESLYNLENRFTGWTDVDLTDDGYTEARKAGAVLKKHGFLFDVAHTSVLKARNPNLMDRSARNGPGLDSCV